MLTASSSPSPAAQARPGPSSPGFHACSYVSSSRSAAPKTPRVSPRPFSNPVSEPRSPRTQTVPVSVPSVPTQGIIANTSDSSHLKQNVDTGTQYTPPDWPPTSSRSSLRLPHEQPKTQSATVPLPVQETPSSGSAPQLPITEPSEPHLRVTPQSALHSSSNATSLRRPSSPSDSSTDLSTNSTHSISSKRPRRQALNGKVMPADYTQCDSKDLVAVISDMLMELVSFNDEIPLKDGHLTRFHSRAPPAISIHDYLTRLTVHATLPPPILLSMVYYIDKLCSLYPPFTINSLTVHRFLITAATVASKGLSDSFWTNNTYARVGGVSIKELALLELELLSRVQWRIVPTPETLKDYYRNLVERSEDYVAEDKAQRQQQALTEIAAPDPMDTNEDGDAAANG